MSRGLAFVSLLAGLAVLLSGLSAHAQVDIEYFEYDDGVVPPGWTRTAFPEAGGFFEVRDGAFTEVVGGAVYYNWLHRRHLGAYHTFRVRGGHWVYAWRIGELDPFGGRCLLLHHDDSSGSWAIGFTEFAWENPDPVAYPDGYYIWNNGVSLRSVYYPTEGPLEDWHIVHIECLTAGSVRVKLDDELIFDDWYAPIDMGYFIGLGSSGGSAMVPAFDWIEVAWPDPVESGTWGKLKSMFR